MGDEHKKDTESEHEAALEAERENAYDKETNGTTAADATDADISIEPDADDSSAVAKLKHELKTCRAERQEYLAGWQRTRADLANVRSEAAAENARKKTEAEKHVLQHVLPVLDSFDGAFRNTEAWEAVDAEWRRGVENIYTQLQGVLREYNVAKMDAHGAQFDPSLHEPVAIEPTDDPHADNTVVAVLQAGYLRGDAVLRPATVRIAQLDADESHKSENE